MSQTKASVREDANASPTELGKANNAPTRYTNAPRTGREIQPRVIRVRDASFYLGMDRNRFNAEVRPFLTEIPIGSHGVGFDRVELDAWLDEYVARNGRPGQKGANQWDANACQASSRGRGRGISTKLSSGGEFAKALEQLSLRKRSGSSAG